MSGIISPVLSPSFSWYVSHQPSQTVIRWFSLHVINWLCHFVTVIQLCHRMAVIQSCHFVTAIQLCHRVAVIQPCHCSHCHSTVSPCGQPILSLSGCHWLVTQWLSLSVTDVYFPYIRKGWLVYDMSGDRNRVWYEWVMTGVGYDMSGLWQEWCMTWVGYDRRGIWQEWDMTEVIYEWGMTEVGYHRSGVWQK